MPAEPSEVTPGRSIGEILLARSLVTDEQLDDAVAIQRQTGKPLGQILVEAGTITRLELASALAEQWGDAGTISPTFPGGSAYIDPTDQDANPAAQLEELKRTRRALEERMLAFERTATDADWQQEMAAGMRALFGRVDVLEAAQGQLSDRHDAAFSDDLRNAVVELAQRVAAVTPELDELRDRLEGTASVAAVQYGLSELAERIDELQPQVERTDAQADHVTDRVEEVAAGLAAAIDELRRSVQATATAQGELTRRLEGTASLETVGSLHTAIEQVRGAVVELSRRPAGDPGLAARLEALAVDIASRADNEALAALAAVVESLSERSDVEPALMRTIDELATRVDELSERIELGAGTPAAAGEADPRVDSLIARVAELAARPATDADLEARVVDMAQRVDALARDLGTRPADDASRLTERLQRVEAVAAELAARPVVDSRLDELAERVQAVASDLAMRSSLEGRLDEVAHHVDAVSAELAGRADAAGQAELSRLVAELAERPTADPSLTQRLDALAAELGELAARPQIDPALTARVDELAARVDEGVAAPAEPAPDPRVDALVASVAELSAQLGAIAERPAGAEAPVDDERVAAAAQLSRRLAGDLTEAAAAWADGRRELDARIEWLAARVEAVVAAPPAAPAAPAATPAKGERAVVSADADVERLKMTVERLMLDFAEHRRALSAAVPGRDLEEKVRRLTDQMMELSGLVVSVEGSANGGAPAGGGGSIDRELASQVRTIVGRLEEVEASSAAGRETMLARLERMMGTIDWRLQRLENPGA